MNILNADQENAARHFASRKDTQATFEYGREAGFVWLAHSNAVFHCHLEKSYPGGDHRIIIGSVENMSGPDNANTCSCITRGITPISSRKRSRIAMRQELHD